ncbi:MAG: FecR domain-containing protein [Desulfobacterales bacterium]|nr:FecR domain-containing protein [Desulfobacterales bacterium]
MKHAQFVKRVSTPMLGLIFCGMYFWVSINVSQAATFAGKLISAKGNIEYSEDGGINWKPATLLMEFPEGTCVRVGNDGNAALLLNDHSQVRLRSGSLLCLKKSGSSPGEAPEQKGHYLLEKGNLWFRNKRKGPKPVFETPVITASIRGTEMAISVNDDGQSEVTVLEGNVLCANGFGESAIARGQSAIIKTGSAPQVVTLVKPENAVQWLLITPEITGPKDMDIAVASEKDAVASAQQSMTLLAQNDIEGALKLAQVSVTQAPSRATPHVALATILQTKGQFEEALVHAKTASSIDPNSVPALLRTVELFLGLDEVDKAATHIQQFSGQKDARIDMLHGYVALIQLDTEKAKTYFNNAIQQYPDMAYAYVGLGIALYSENQIEAGLENMEKACLLDPLAAYPHNYLGKGLYARGEREEAEIEFKRASELDPLDPSPYMYLATLFTDNYRPGEGVLSLEKALQLNDNRLMSRSRFLLDQDKAAKNVSLAWSLSEMGLHKWARSKGNLAVWDDQANSSAYLFRASEAVGLKQVDASTLGDIKRSELLKPVNANTYISYNEYQDLLEIPKIAGSISAVGGNDGTWTGLGDINGGNRQVAFHAAGKYNTTDGPIDGTGRWYGLGSLNVKSVVVSDHEVLADFVGDYIHDKDLRPWQDLDIKRRDQDIKKDYWAGNIGYHWKQKPGMDLLCLVQYSGSDSDTFTQFQRMNMAFKLPEYIVSKINSDTETWRAELLELFKISNHNLSLGMSWKNTSGKSYIDQEVKYDVDWLSGQRYNRSLPNSHNDEQRVYFRDIWKLPVGIYADLGLAYCQLDGVWRDTAGKDYRKKRTLPHAGLAWNLSAQDTFRIGYFQELQPDYLSGTLQPVEVAGFSTITGTNSGTLTEYYGFAWDKQWHSQVFSTATLYRRDRQYPGNFASHPEAETWREESTDGFNVTLETLITHELALALIYELRQVNPIDPDRERLDHDLGSSVTYVHSSGWRYQLGLHYVHQDEGKGFKTNLGDSFFIGSMSFDKSLFDKKVNIFFHWENIIDSDFQYLVIENSESAQLAWQKTLVKLGVTWNF